MAIPALFVVHILSFKFTRLRALKFANFEILEKAVGVRKGVSKNYTLFFIRAFILLLLIMAAAGSVYWYYGRGSAFNYVIAIDASISMGANDYEPNRIEAAKEAALGFLDVLDAKADVGVVTFTGITFIKQKLTNNMIDIRSAIRGIGLEESGGTSLGDAMIASTNLFEDNKKANVIILITDGQQNVGLDPSLAIDYLNDNNVLVNTVGIGTKEGGEFIEGVRGVSKLDEDTLMYIAEATNGEYFWAPNVDELKNAFKKIAKAKRERLSMQLGPVFMAVAVTLLILEWGLMNTRYRMLP